jgi:hypothetical protein
VIRRVYDTSDVRLSVVVSVENVVPPIVNVVPAAAEEAEVVVVMVVLVMVVLFSAVSVSVIVLVTPVFAVTFAFELELLVLLGALRNARWRRIVGAHLLRRSNTRHAHDGYHQDSRRKQRNLTLQPSFDC